MNKFASWLNQHHGMATKVAKSLNVNRASVSNCKTGKMPMPIGWIDTISSMSKRQLTHKDLLAESARIRKLRANTKQAQS